MKRLVSTLTVLICFLAIYAAPYTVTASSLNLREAPSTSSSVAIALPKESVVEVTDIDGEWATVSYNGKQYYAAVKYLTPLTGQGNLSSSNEKKSWNFFSWLLDSGNEPEWFTVIKWIVLIGIAIFLVKVALLIVARMIAYGVALGGIALAIGFIIEWIGWIETNTMWNIASWGFYVGMGLGVLDSFIHFRDVIDDASTDTNETSSTGSADGLKRYRIVVNNELYTLTQDCKYNESVYKDQWGKTWYYDSSGFHPGW